MPRCCLQLRLAKEKSEAELSAKAAASQLQLCECQRECDLLKRALSKQNAQTKKMERLKVLGTEMLGHLKG